MGTPSVVNKALKKNDNNKLVNISLKFKIKHQYVYF
jgi:hypothetical protein